MCHVRGVDLDATSDRFRIDGRLRDLLPLSVLLQVERHLLRVAFFQRYHLGLWFERAVAQRVLRPHDRADGAFVTAVPVNR